MDMDDNVLKFKGTTLASPTKIKITDTKNGPILETTVAENIVLKKFLTFAIKDVEFQINMIKDSELSKEKLEQSIFASGFILEYLKILLQEIEKSSNKVIRGK